MATLTKAMYYVTIQMVNVKLGEKSMDWINKLERKFGKYAFTNVMKYVVILQLGGFAIFYISPEFYSQYLSMNAQGIMEGQIWRIVTFLMEPPSYNPIFLMFALYLYYMIGQSLETVWGAFRLNLYLISGVLFHVIAAFLALLITGFSFPLGTTYLYLSMFFAFALYFPDTKFLLLYILPVKVKYLALFNAFFFALPVIQAFIPTENPLEVIVYRYNAIASVVSILNFLIFYFSSSAFRGRSPKEMARKKRYQNEVRRNTRPATKYPNGAKHRCATCGRTELDDSTLEFRYCSKCKGNLEYCQEHLFTHEHVK